MRHQQMVRCRVGFARLHVAEEQAARGMGCCEAATVTLLAAFRVDPGAEQLTRTLTRS
jgi:hypothetical protein